MTLHYQGVVSKWLRSLHTLMEEFCLFALGLTDVPNLVGVLVVLLVRTSDQSAVFIDGLSNLFLTWCVGSRSI